MYMIERRYGRCNRDWLHCFDANGTSVWVCGGHRAQIYSTRRAARIALAKVKEDAAKWTNFDGTPCDRFEFVLIQDRRHTPYYFASVAA